MKKIKTSILIIMIFAIHLTVVIPIQTKEGISESEQIIIKPQQKISSLSQTTEPAIPLTTVSPNSKMQLPQYPENITTDISQESWYNYLYNISSFTDRQDESNLYDAFKYVEGELEGIGLNAIITNYTSPLMESTNQSWDFETDSDGWSLFSTTNTFTNNVWETQFATDDSSDTIEVNTTISKYHLSSFDTMRVYLSSNTSIRIALDGQSSTLIEGATAYQTIDLSLKDASTYTSSSEYFNVTFSLTFTDVIGNFDGDEHLAINTTKLVSTERSHSYLFAESQGYSNTITENGLSEQYITLTSHLDGITSTTGVYESASGVSSLLEIARILYNYQSPIGWRLLITSSSINPNDNFSSSYGMEQFFTSFPSKVLNTKEFIHIDHTTRGSNYYIEKMGNSSITQWALPERITNKVLDIVDALSLTPIEAEKTWRYATEIWDKVGIPGTFIYSGNNPYYETIPDDVLYHTNDTLTNVVNATALNVIKIALSYVTHAIKQETPKITAILNSLDITFDVDYTNLSSQQIRDLRNSGYVVDQVVYLSNLLDSAYPTLVTRLDVTYSTWKGFGSSVQWDYFGTQFDIAFPGAGFNSMVYLFHNGEDIETVGNLFTHAKHPDSIVKGLLSDHPSLFTNQTFTLGHETDYTIFIGTYGVDTAANQFVSNGNLITNGLDTSSLHKLSFGGFTVNADTHKYFIMKMQTTQALIGVNLFNEQNELIHIFPYTDIIDGSQVLYIEITDGNWTDVQNGIYIQIAEPFGSSWDPGDSFIVDWFAIGTMANNTVKPGLLENQHHDEDMTVTAQNNYADYFSFGSSSSYTSNINYDYAVNTTLNCDIRFYIQTFIEPTICTSERGDFSSFGHIRFGFFSLHQNLTTMFDFSEEDMDYRNQLISWSNSYWNYSLSTPMNLTINTLEQYRTPYITTTNEIYHISITSKDITTSTESNTVTLSFNNINIDIQANFTDSSTINMFIEKDNATNLINVPTYTFDVDLELSTAVPIYLGYSEESKYVVSQNSVFKDFWSTLWQTKDIQYLRYNGIVSGSDVSFVQEDTYGIEKTGSDPIADNHCLISAPDIYCYPNNRTESHILISSPFESTKLDITGGTIGINDLAFSENHFIFNTKKENGTGPQTSNSDYYGEFWTNVLQAPVKWNTDGKMNVNDTGLEWVNTVNDAWDTFIPMYDIGNLRVQHYLNYTEHSSHKVEAYAEVYNDIQMRVTGFNSTVVTETKDGDSNVFLGMRGSKVQTSAILVQIKTDLKEIEHNGEPPFNLTTTNLVDSVLITWISETGQDTLAFYFTLTPKNNEIVDDPEDRGGNRNIPVVLFVFFMFGMLAIGVFFIKAYFEAQQNQL
jgi:hypothetical protein